MKLLPASLFRRNLLLLAGLILAGQLIGALVFTRFVLRPRAVEFAATIAHNVIAVREGLAALPEAQRAAFTAAFNASQEAAGSSFAREPGHAPLGLRPMERLLLRYTSAQLATRGIQAVWRQDSPDRLYLRLQLDERPHWLYTPALRASFGLPRAALTVWALSVLLALAGAYLIQRRLSRPLAALAGAAEELGRGARPAPLPEDGPSEIASLSRGFNRMMGELARQERERGIMLAGISHDLRTPLAKMRLAFEMLDGQADPELLASLVRASRQIDASIEQFVDFARDGESAEPVSATDLPALLRACAARLDPPPQLDLADLPALALRPQAFARLVDNLLQNAQRYGHRPDATPEIVLACRALSAGGVEVCVADRGPGIPPDQVEALLQPFARGDGARGGPPGSGLGLAIAARIARLHRGTLELLPRPGGGLLARVLLPLAEPGAGRPA